MKHKPKFLVARWKILVANLSFKNQNEENAFVFGAAMAIYTPTTENPRQKNRMPAIYQGHPTDRFDKLSVRKALNPLQFSEGNFHLELS